MVKNDYGFEFAMTGIVLVLLLIAIGMGCQAQYNRMSWTDGFSEGYRYGLKTHNTPEDPDVALVRWNKDKR